MIERNLVVNLRHMSRRTRCQEFGRAHRIEKQREFQQECPEGERPPFPSSLCYDSKGWMHAKERARKSRGVVLFWNVGS
eukprot:SAG25_NODE_764_length_5503_cov_13.115470_3_plen_79_part_00